MNYFAIFIMIISSCCTMYELVRDFCFCLKQILMRKNRIGETVALIVNLMMYGILCVFFVGIFYCMLVSKPSFSFNENLLPAIQIVYIFMSVYRGFSVCSEIKKQETHNLKELLGLIFLKNIYALTGMNFRPKKYITK